jgi:hypothetical protein
LEGACGLRGSGEVELDHSLSGSGVLMRRNCATLEPLQESNSFSHKAHLKLSWFLWTLGLDYVVDCPATASKLCHAGSISLAGRCEGTLAVLRLKLHPNCLIAAVSPFHPTRQDGLITIDNEVEPVWDVTRML